jgi:hypothetical protein
MEDESRELHGQGLVDWFNKAKSVVKETVTRVKSAVRGVRDGYPPSAKQALDRFADWTITSLTVRRDPVQSMINSALNAVSLGNWNKSRAEHGIDKLYHLGLVLGLASPSGEHHDFLAEKNAVINFGFPKAVTGTTQILRVPAPSPPETLGPFMAKAEEMMGKQAFFQYDSFQNNCQDFIRGILNANGVLTPQADAFLKQDLEKVVNSQPKHLGIVANAVTNLGARVDRLVQGGDICGRGMSGGTLAELRAARGMAHDHFLRARDQFRVQRSTRGCTQAQYESAHNKMRAAITHLDNLRLKIEAAEAAEAAEGGVHGRGLSGGGKMFDQEMAFKRQQALIEDLEYKAFKPRAVLTEEEHAKWVKAKTLFQAELAKLHEMAAALPAARLRAVTEARSAWAPAIPEGPPELVDARLREVSEAREARAARSREEQEARQARFLASESNASLPLAGTKRGRGLYTT